MDNHRCSDMCRWNRAAVSVNIQGEIGADLGYMALGLEKEKQDCFFASSPSGWIIDELGFEWLRTVFDRNNKNKARRSWRLLILDGHGSHLTMKFIECCHQNKILLAFFPTHATHTLQSLDVCLFRPLSQTYSDELAKFAYACQGFSALSKREFFCLFWVAWKASFTTENRFAGLEATGLNPFNTDRVIIKFNKQDNGDRSTSSSSTGSVLHIDDWKRIEKLLRSIVADIYDKKAKKLSNTMHALTVRNMLLDMENKGLKAYLVNKKKHRKRGKPLLLEATTDEHDGAQFLSPNKIDQAFERRDQKLANEEAESIQKQVDKVRREAEKAGKARLT